MRVNHPASPNVQSTQTNQTEQAKKSEQAQKNKSRSATEIYGNNAAASSDAKTEISAKGREFATARATAAAAPDVREDKIAELKKRIAEGKYEVDANKVADKMVRDHMAF